MKFLSLVLIYKPHWSSVEGLRRSLMFCLQLLNWEGKTGLSKAVLCCVAQPGVEHRRFTESIILYLNNIFVLMSKTQYKLKFSLLHCSTSEFDWCWRTLLPKTPSKTKPQQLQQKIPLLNHPVYWVVLPVCCAFPSTGFQATKFPCYTMFEHVRASKCLEWVEFSTQKLVQFV